MFNLAAQKPGPVTVQVYSQSERLLGEIDFQYIDLTDRVAYEAVQHGIEGVTKLFSLMGKHSVNMWNQSASVKQNTGKYLTCLLKFTSFRQIRSVSVKELLTCSNLLGGTFKSFQELVLG